MKKPARNRCCGGMGKRSKTRASAAKVMGRGKVVSGGTAYPPKSRRGATKGTRHLGSKGGGNVMGYGPRGR